MWYNKILLSIEVLCGIFVFKYTHGFKSSGDENIRGSALFYFLFQNCKRNQIYVRDNKVS